MSHREGAPRSHADVDGARGPCTSHIESEGNLMWIGWKAISLGVVSGGAIAVALYSSLAAGSAAPSASIPISQTVPTAVYADCVEPIRLEGILEMPEKPEPPPACILCHPHPIGGGSMYVPLLEVMARRLAESGWACLRFNFRGVGLSSGVPTGGLCEVEDVEGAYRFLADREDVDCGELALAGWSFGAWIGLRWAVGSGNVSRTKGRNLRCFMWVGFCFAKLFRRAIMDDDDR